MTPYENMQYHPASEELVDIMINKIGTKSPMFFRAVVAYYFSVVAASMRCNLKTQERGTIPVNTYAIGLGPSGMGKTRAVNIMQHEILTEFFDKFENETFLLRAEENMPKIAHKRAMRKGTDPDDELQKVQKEFSVTCGDLYMSFDSGSGPALKQMRHKLLMAKAGSLNLQVDEIADNLIGLQEMLSAYLELYDVGLVGDKITKNSKDNFRAEAVGGRSPANALLFGTPASLMDGGAIESQFLMQLQKGLARRCVFGHSFGETTIASKNPEDILDERMSSNSDAFMDQLADHFGKLADIINMDKNLIVSREVTLENIRYEQDCKERSEKLNKYEAIRKTEYLHRANKALKLAGAYAFVDESPEVTMNHLHAAIKVIEDSGIALANILDREQNHVKLARYIAESGKELTHPDLLEELPFYPKAASARNELMQLAVAHGYQNNIIIKNRFQDSVEFIWGESLTETNLNEIMLAHSDDMAKNYEPATIEWADLANLARVSGMHWTNHGFENGHRTEANAIPGFNLVVVDVDGQISMEAAKNLLSDYQYFMYTTKRHTPEVNRFRIVFPTNYVLKLNSDDYKEFMNNVFEWLPFESDEQTNQRNKKWLTHKGHYEFNDGELLDVLPFIPSTSRNADHKKTMSKMRNQQSLDNLERWVIRTAKDGNTNNQLIKYALVLVDSSFGYNEIYERVKNLNSKLSKSLSDAEILSTVMKTVGNRLNAQPA